MSNKTDHQLFTAMTRAYTNGDIQFAKFCAEKLLNSDLDSERMKDVRHILNSKTAPHSIEHAMQRAFDHIRCETYRGLKSTSHPKLTHEVLNQIAGEVRSLVEQRILEEEKKCL